VSNPASKRFIESVLRRPNFDFAAELVALHERHGDGPEFVQAVIDDKQLPKDDACKLWADSFNVAYVDPFASVVTDEAVEHLPVEIARKTKAIGLYVLNGVLTVALATPGEPDLVKRLSQIAQMPVSPVFALPREIEDAIAIHYCTEKNLEESLSELEHSTLFDRSEIAADKLATLAENNSLAEILDEIIYFSMRERATDLHFEAQEQVCRIRFRVDGNLREILTYSPKLHRALISRVKILCGLNISESRFPQDGRFSMPIGTQTANFRVSTIPSAYGEKPSSASSR
jgi:type IV pilus assembly protein PilB